MTKKKTNFLKNYWVKVKVDFKLTTHKITLIAIFLALTVLISLLEIPSFFNDFLTLDFSISVLLLTVFIIGLPYSLLIAVIYPWIRLGIPHTAPPNAIGEIANMLSAITSLIVFFLIHDLLMLLIKGHKESWKPHLVINIISAIFACLVISLLNTFYNWIFILDLYGVPQLKSILWTVFLPYNLFKFTLVLTLFLLLEKPISMLKRHFNL